MKIAVYNVQSSASVRLCFTNMGPSIAGTYAVQDVTGVSLTGLRSVRSELIGDGVIKAVSGGRCGIVLDEGLLFRANEDAFVKTKRKLLDDCEVWCIVSLPAGVFTAAEAGVKTNLLFFTKGKPTQKIWYYDLTDVKVRKKTPLLLKHFEDFHRLLPDRADSELSWTVDIEERKRRAGAEERPFKELSTKRGQQAEQWKERAKELKRADAPDEAALAAAEEQARALTKEAREAAAKAKEIEDAVYDLKAVNPHRKQVIDTRTPEELLDIIEAKGREIAEVIALLREK